MLELYFLAGERVESIIRQVRWQYRLVEFEGIDEAVRTAGVVLAGADTIPTKTCFDAASADLCLLLVANDEEVRALPTSIASAVFATLPIDPPLALLRRVVENAHRSLEFERRAAEAEERLERQSVVTRELNRIGVALSSERDTVALLGLIVSASRELTHSDAASLYLVEADEEGGQRLRFKFAQNQSVDVPVEEFTLPISDESIAGFVAQTGFPLAIADVYKLPQYVPYVFNQAFDDWFGYVTKSMLVVPLLDTYNRVLGVLQLINHKKDPNAQIVTREAADLYVDSYPQDLVDVAASLGSQAAVALENSILYQDIRKLFEGFVKASVTAIEQRDPTTSGHSARVAELTVGLAELVDRASDGPFRALRFDRNQLTEIRYASLLHDFGKVGIRESVLVKAKKLYPRQLEVMRWRFWYYRKAVEAGFARDRLDYVLKNGLEAFLAARPDLDAEVERELRRVDDMWATILQSNEPTVLPEGSFELLAEIAERTFEAVDGSAVSLLSNEEVRTLSIPRGSLNEDERRAIEQHVVHTFTFLSQIPWTDEWREIPRIAAYHHEKLDGRGYPHGVRGEEIPIQSRMMTISDIFDALTASDRPYKRAVPVPKALDIIESEVRSGQLDAALFDVFLTSKVYERVIPSE